MALGAVRYEIVAWLAQLGERRFADREVAGPAGHQYSRSLNTVTIPKISHGAYIFQRPFLGGLSFGTAYIRRGLSTWGNWLFKTDWASSLLVFSVTPFKIDQNLKNQNRSVD